MSNRPEISVIIPVYNGEKTIKKTIESVLRQNFYHIEIIIIDDGSTDSTLEIINSIDDIRLQVFSYRNAGLAVSRNRGIEKANGDYISFIDADDLWTSDKLEAQYKALQDNPNASVAYSWTDYIDETDNFLKPGQRVIATGDVYSQLLQANFLENGSNPLIYKKAINEVGRFDETLPAVEDWDMWLRLSAKYEFICVEKPQILYRMSSHSMSTNLKRQESALLTVIEKAFLNQKAINLKHLKKYSLANIYRYLTFKAIDSNTGKKINCKTAYFLYKYMMYESSFFRKSKNILIALFKILIPLKRNQMLSFKKKLKLRLDYFLDCISTEYNFRFRRQEIQEELNPTRKIPQNLHIEGTNTCNAKCVFCAYPQMERVKETMPMEEFQRIIDEYVAMGGKYVSLTPIVGDPFIDSYFFDRLKYLDNIPEIKGFYFYTNGILMKPKVSQQLLSYGDKLSIYVSWGGFDRETYKSTMGVDYFELVRQNIEAFIDAKRQLGSATTFTIALRCPFSNCNGELWEKFHQWKREKLISWYFIDGYDTWAGKVKAEDLRKVGLEPTPMPHKRGACELLYMKPIILANSKVNACACRDVEVELVIGDLKKEKLSDIWAGKEIDKIIERHERGDFPDVCKRCTWYTSIYNLRKRHSRIDKAALHWSEN
ncbi:MAG: glycosyltransferase [Calothrix sp. MO_167.B42]|nr:glycosyltransferase [Calothrix sp. MO_167.B42]